MAERAPPNSRRIAFAPRLVIMAKSPGAGQVKRRLGASLGAVAACNVYRSCLAHTLRRLSVSPRWHTVLAITPDADLAAPHWLRLAPTKSVARLGQGRGGLGRRMQRLFARLPPGPAIIIGNQSSVVPDCPRKSGGMTPTTVNGCCLMKIVWPRTCRSPPNR